MTKLFTILGVIFAVILVTVIIAAAILIPHAFKLKHEATTYIQKAVPSIAKHWNPQELTDRASAGLLKVPKYQEQIDSLFETYSNKLGALKHLDTPKGKLAISTGTGGETVANYKVQAQFEKGTATIEIKLLRVGDAWKIDSFYIDSHLFVPP